jgi:gamma-glutamyl:cysteine ligase YbdK (ATP-grasp superfamily)
VTIPQAFGESAPFSLGVEEELMILDAATHEQVAAVDRILRGVDGLSLPGRLKTELFASVFEINTNVCATVDEVDEALPAPPSTRASRSRRRARIRSRGRRRSRS